VGPNPRFEDINSYVIPLDQRV